MLGAFLQPPLKYQPGLRLGGLKIPVLGSFGTKYGSGWMLLQSLVQRFRCAWKAELFPGSPITWKHSVVK